MVKLAVRSDLYLHLAGLFFLFGQFSVLFSQNIKTKLFPFTDNKSLVVWNNDNQYKAQFILKDGGLDGITFLIYSNELITSNPNDEFMVTKTYDFPGTEFWPSSSAIKAKIYHSPEDTTNSFAVTSFTWPECGMGFLGYEEQLLNLSNNFLHVDQYDGNLSGHFFDSSGENISYFFREGNASHISSDGLPDSSLLIIWFNARFDEFENTLPYGIYATYLENSMIKKDSILIKTYPHFPEYLIDMSPEIIPFLKIKTLTDTSYQLFVVEPDSSFLYSYILNSTAGIEQIEKYEIPQLHDLTRIGLQGINALNISNFSERTRSLFLSTSDYYHYSNYLFYFSAEGVLSNGPITDTTRIFPNDYFLYKTGSHTFLNSSDRGNNIYADSYNNFVLEDSFKIGQISAIDDDEIKPVNFCLYQNYPNPFNPVTVIEYQIPQAGEVELSIYNTLGQRVATLVSAKQPAGKYSVRWDASDFPSGVYFCRLRTEQGLVQSRKLVLLK